MIDQWLMALILLVPIIGALLALAFPRTARRSQFVAAAMTTGLTGIWLAFSVSGFVAASTRLTAGTWLTIPSGLGIPVELTFELDQPRALLILMGSNILLFSLQRNHPPRSRSMLLALLLLPLASASLLAVNLIVVVFLWGLIDFCLCLSSLHGDSGSRPGRTGNFINIVRCSSALLLLAVLIIAVRFGTATIDTILAEIATDERLDARSVMSGLTVVLAGAIACRIGVAPFFPWVRGKSGPDSAQSEFSAATITLAGVLPGIGLAIAVLPVAGSAPDGFLLLGALGALSVIASSISLVQPDSESAATPLAVCVGAMGCTAMATAQPGGTFVAAALVFAQLSAVVVLAKQPRWLFTRWLVLAVAVSGGWGQNASLTLLESSMLQSATTARHSLYGDWLMTAVWWGIVVGQIHWGFVVLRLSHRSQNEQGARRTPSHSPESDQPSTAIIPLDQTSEVLLLAAAMLAVGAGLLPVSSQLPAGLLTFGAATPACLLGVVFAWLVVTADEESQAKMKMSFAKVHQKYRDWYSIDAYWHNGIVLPAKFLATTIALIDRKIFGGTREEGWRQMPIQLSETLEHLRLQPPVYYGLIMLLMVVGLLWTMS